MPGQESLCKNAWIGGVRNRSAHLRPRHGTAEALDTAAAIPTSIVNEPWDSTGLYASGDPCNRSFYVPACRFVFLTATEPCSSPAKADLPRITLIRPR
jgi:hypothetical protein